MEITHTDIDALHQAEATRLSSGHHEDKPEPMYALGYIGAALVLAERCGLLDMEGMPNSDVELARAGLRRALEMYRRT